MRLPFADSTTEGSAAMRMERVWSSSRAIYEGKRAGVDVADLPLLHISVTKKSYCDEATLSIELENDMSAF